MNLLDWCLLVLVALYMLSGYWQGFITGAFATVGLLLGFVAGAWLAPKVLGDRDESLWVSLGVLFIVIMCASLGQGLLQWLGARIRDRITWQPVRAVDAIGGAALSGFAALLVAWALGIAVSNTRLGAVTEAVRESKVLATVDKAIPAQVRDWMSNLDSLVGEVFPPYLEPFAPERIVEVEPGPKRLERDPDVLATQPSVIKIIGENKCGRGVEGSGWVYAPGRLMTSAHVVAGVGEPELTINGEQVTGQVVLFDADLDVAVVKFDAEARPLRFGSGGESEQGVAILGYPEDGPFDIEPARIRTQQRLRSPNIYGEGTVIRDVFSVRGNVRPGNSGGPLVGSKGNVLGMVFADSLTDDETGYALTAEQLAQSAAAGITGTNPVGTGACTG